MFYKKMKNRTSLWKFKPVMLGRFSVRTLEDGLLESMVSREGVREWFREDPELFFVEDPDPEAGVLFFL